MTENFNMATATPEELKAWAANTLDLKLALTMNPDTMREKIVAKCKELQIDPPMAEILTKHDRVAQNAGSRKTKSVIINIAKSDKPGGSDPVFVGVQGVGYTVPRGIDIAVSPAIVEVLKNAMTDLVTQDTESGELLHNEVTTYPFSVVRNEANYAN